MRKDVKLGMAIGGGLIVLLVGYLLLSPPANNNKKGAQFAAGTGNIIDPGGAGDLSSQEEKPAKPATDGAGAAAGGAPDTHLIGTPAKPAEGGARPDAKPDNKPNVNTWDNALVKGKVGVDPQPKPKEADHAKPTPHEETEGRAAPVPASPPKLLFNPNAALGDGLSTDAVFGSPAQRPGRSDLVATSSRADGASEPAGGGGTHIVKAGETLSSIALAAYGSAAYYPHILRANPNINPNNLKLGTPLKMPHINDVKADAASDHASGHAGNEPAAAPEVKIDPSKQYKVQPGDSLYKISMKVYGKSSYVDKIYEKNKALIGADNKRLKLGMILDLPEKTASAAAAPADSTASSLSGAGSPDASEENQAK